MPRFGFDDGKQGITFFNFSKTDDHKSAGKETGDASFYHPTENGLTNDDSNSVSKQKREFTRYINSKKKTLSKPEPSEVAVNTQNQPWDYKPNIKCILEPGQKDADMWLDDCAISAGSDGDHFNKVYNAKSPSAEKAATLLDELVELRGELFDRIKELAKFKQDVREVGKLIRDDPWAKVQTLSAVSSQLSAWKADKVLDSVELTTHKIESLCGELDQGSSQTYLS